MGINFSLRKYLNPVFVETGTKYGNGVRAALNAGFQKVYSIEIVPERYKKSRQKFSKEISNGKVEIVLGDSAEKLEEIISHVGCPITFWLDAHNVYHSSRILEVPLFNEL